jgi:hypothetical protein
MRREVAPNSVVIPTRFRPPHVIQEKFACRLRSNPFKPFDLRNPLTLPSFSLISFRIDIISPYILILCSISLPPEAVSGYGKRRAVEWKRFGPACAKAGRQPLNVRILASQAYIYTFGFIQATISHNLRDPHSKSWQPDGLLPRIAITTQTPRGEGK